MRVALPVSIAALALGVLGDTTCSNNLTVQTSTGTFTGIVEDAFPNTRQWRAIPFAQPPTGSRRWLPPQQLPPSDDHHYVSRFPASCAQFVTADPRMYFWASNYTRGNLIYNGAQNDSSGLVAEASSEDCLYLAVWAPAAHVPVPEGGFPVVFFMTGGGFALGGIDIPWQMPTGWVERSQSHIVVTINYRLGIFGFPNARGLAGEDFSQNLGILDQRKALEWVRDNIEAFGGNPERITQWGRSAGSMSADAHAFAYHDDPIAQGYWMQSGNVVGSSFIFDPTYSNFSFVAEQLGCGVPCGPEDKNASAQFELDCMRQIPFAQIVNFIGQRTDRYETPAIAFSLTQDDRIIFSDYFARAEAGLVARRPTIISTTSNEIGSIMPWPAENVTEGPWQPPIDEWNILYSCMAWNSTRLRNGLGIPVYRFQYAGVFPNLNAFDWLGAYHASDIPASFGTYHLMDHIAPSTQLQADTSQAMQDYFLAFVKDPYNGPEREYGWEPMDTSKPNGGSLLRLGAGGKAVQFIDGIEVDGVCEGKGEYDSFPE
ncbi:hypothetical protein NLU13_7928 [Sarocladium strictum]|uniref:Carboxylesterase type B domain-containing protein n=1 Tax=Sarocladium strictum TaxID=5046 RepID=A0AA39GG33_SARSR|nr:hypothetical protein NLU13_7928 [Sarocladium strictum]